MTFDLAQMIADRDAGTPGKWPRKAKTDRAKAKAARKQNRNRK